MRDSFLLHVLFVLVLVGRRCVHAGLFFSTLARYHFLFPFLCVWHLSSDLKERERRRRRSSRKILSQVNKVHHP